MTLLTNIQELSRDKTRCTELLQAFLDGKCSVLEGNEEHVDCYWILLTTHFIQRMVNYLEKHAGHEDCAVILSATCHALATALYSDKNKLERSAQKTGNVRSALGRAIMSITIGSTSALQHIGQGSGTTEPSLIRRAVWAATTALDITVNHSPSKSTASSSDAWNHAEHWLLEDAAHLDMKHEEELAAVCEAACKALNITKDEHACIDALVENDSAQSQPTGKRRRGSRKDDSPPAIAHHFQSLMKTQLSTHIDGRVSIRRWASMTFVWFCRGQENMLEFVDGVLSDGRYWNVVLDCPAVVGPKDPPPKKKSGKGKKGSRKRPVEEPSKVTPPVYIPGNVSAVALASRLISILSETGASCGVRAPTGGLDTFAENMYGLTGPGKGRGRGGAESAPSWARPDVRNLSSVVIYKLIQSHTACLQKNCTSPDSFECVLVNDETDGFGSPVPIGATRPLQARFYPCVHKSLNSLCFAAASSGPAESTNVNSSSKRLLGITSAFILASREQCRSIVDAKLYGLAVGQVVEYLRSIVGEDNRGSTSSAMEVDSIEGQEDLYERINTEYSLDQPLPVPALSASQAKTSRKKKKSTNTQVSPACTFGGMFPQQASDPAGEAETVFDEDLLFFIVRAMRSTSDEEPPTVAIFTELIEIVRCCYDLTEPAFEAPATVDVKSGDSSKRKGKKRASSSKATQGKRKRKKVSVDSSEVARGDEDDEDKTLCRAPK